MIQSIYNMKVCLWAKMLAFLSMNVVFFRKFNAKKYSNKYKMELITIPSSIEQINKFKTYLNSKKLFKHTS
jgi:hypothetical protein